MATKIVTKNSSTASAVPTASDLVQGELAVNVADKRLFTEDNAGAIVELGTNPYNFTANHNGSAKLATTSTGIDVTGTATMDGLTVDGSGTGQTFQFIDTSEDTTLFASSGNTSGKNTELVLRARASNSWVSSGFRTNTDSLDFYAGEATGATLSGGTKRMTIADNGDISFYEDTGTTAKFFWDASAESLGIGASSPSKGLHLNFSNDLAAIRFQNTANAKVWDLTPSIPDVANSGFSLHNVTDNTIALHVDNSNNVGIGTSSPASPTGFGSSGILHLKGGTGNDCSIVLEGLSGSGGRQEIGASGGALQFYRGAAAGSMTESMRIDASGNLLVGTTDTTPGIGDTNAGISMSATNGIIISRANDAPINISRNSSDGALTYFRKDGAIVGSIGTQGGDLYLGTDDANIKFFNSASIQPVNSVGGVRDNAIDIGASSARFKDLYLSGKAIVGAGSASAPSITASNDTDAGLFWGGGFLGFTGGSSNQMRLDSSGNLLVGCTAEASATVSGLSVNNAGYINTSRPTTGTAGHHQFFNPNGLCGVITTTGTSTAYNTSSDQRLKDNIVDAPSASDDIDAIQVRSFDWKANGSHQKYGMVAQELLEVAPEAVSVPEDSEEMMGVDYSKLVPMLIKEIQSLRNRVAQLEE